MISGTENDRKLGSQFPKKIQISCAQREDKKNEREDQIGGNSSHGDESAGHLGKKLKFGLMVVNRSFQ